MAVVLARALLVCLVLLLLLVVVALLVLCHGAGIGGRASGGCPLLRMLLPRGLLPCRVCLLAQRLLAAQRLLGLDQLLEQALLLVQRRGRHLAVQNMLLLQPACPPLTVTGGAAPGCSTAARSCHGPGRSVQALQQRQKRQRRRHLPCNNDM